MNKDNDDPTGDHSTPSYLFEVIIWVLLIHFTLSRNARYIRFFNSLIVFTRSRDAHLIYHSRSLTFFTLGRDAHNTYFAISLLLHRSNILELFPKEGQKCPHTLVHAFESTVVIIHRAILELFPLRRQRCHIDLINASSNTYVVIVLFRAILELFPLQGQKCQSFYFYASPKRSPSWRLLPVRRQRCRDKITYASYRFVVFTTLPSLVWCFSVLPLAKF